MPTYDIVLLMLPRCPFCGSPDYRTQRSALDSPSDGRRGRRGRSPGIRHCKCSNPKCRLTFKIALELPPVHPLNGKRLAG